MGGPIADLDQLGDAFDRAERATAECAAPERVPRWRAAVVAAMVTLALVIVSAVSAYVGASVAYERASRRTDQRIASVESGLADRRAAAQRSNADRDQKLAELHRLVCVLADHARPRDAQVEAIRSAYGCTGAPQPAPS